MTAVLALVGGCTGTEGSGSDSEGTGSNVLAVPCRTTDAEKEEYLASHNQVRAALGEPSDYSGTWQPLPDVTWSNGVADSAQGWADHLRDDEDCGCSHDPGSPFGENLAAGSGALSPSQAVALWAEEGNDYRYDPSYEFVQGHYTQLVWRETRDIGCASASCGGGRVVVCRYSPRGNVIGAQPY